MATPREFLASELRRARLDAGFASHDALAVRMGVVRTVVSHAESGTFRVPSDATLTAYATHTGVSAERLIGMAQVARSATDGVPGWIEDYLKAEADAFALKFWQPMIVPAMFQIPDYRRALLADAGHSPEAIDASLAANAERQAVLDRVDPPEVVALIDEFVLLRLIGSRETMHEQLADLITKSGCPNVCIQVVPGEARATAGYSGAMNLATGDGIPDTLHGDALPEGHTTDSRSQVRAAVVAFDRIRGKALPCDLSQARMIEIRDEKWKM
jgi:transcriptional regulator with XRE-family HTH domain